MRNLALFKTARHYFKLLQLIVQLIAFSCLLLWVTPIFAIQSGDIVGSKSGNVSVGGGFNKMPTKQELKNLLTYPAKEERNSKKNGKNNIGNSQIQNAVAKKSSNNNLGETQETVHRLVKQQKIINKKIIGKNINSTNLGVLPRSISKVKILQQNKTVLQNFATLSSHSINQKKQNTNTASLRTATFNAKSNATSSVKPMQPKTIPMANMPGEKISVSNTPKVETANIKIGHRLIRNIPVSANYSLTGRNYISATGINALIFPVPVTSFTPEVGTMDFKWISHNHGIVFKLKNPSLKVVQAIVTLDNESQLPLSLVFDVISSAGRVIVIPHKMVGVTLIRNSSIFNTKTTFDKKIIQLTNMVINHKDLGGEWIHSQKKNIKSPYSQLAISDFQIWENNFYVIKNIKLCSTSNYVSLAESTFSDQKTVAVTLTKHLLKPNECGRVIVIESKSPKLSVFSKKNSKTFSKKLFGKFSGDNAGVSSSTLLDPSEEN